MVTKNSGRKTRNFRKLSRNLRGLKLPCYLCGQPINYEVSAPHPDSFTVEHVKPRSKYPELAEDPGNLKAAHFSCNSAKGVSEDNEGLGFTSREW